MKDMLVNDVSDTSLWIAAFRAEESERPDAVFKDPLARRLAGERGFKIVDSTPHKEAMRFAMVVRTVAIDRLIEQAIQQGIDTVINLGAGMDTRPYRMKLPAGLNWVEVDFPSLIAYKNEQLKDEQPVCKLQRIATDLSDDDQRRQLLAQLGAATSKALVITEGVIAYLTNEDAAKLSHDIHNTSSFHFWIMDYKQGKEHRQREELQKILTNAPFKFKEDKPIEFFQRDGWKVYSDIHMLDEGDRIGRRVPVPFPWNMLLWLVAKPMRAAANKMYGYVMFER